MSSPSPTAAVRHFPVPTHLTRIVDGVAVPPGGGRTLPVVNPATEATLALLVEDDASGVDQAVRAARKAFDEGPWPRMALAERKRIIRNVVDTLAAHADELAWLDCLDTGVPLWDIRGRKMGRMHENFEFFMDVASTMHGETYQQHPSIFTYTTREPAGVAAIIAPWNSPMSIASMQLGPCLAFGNTCVLKPSEHAGLSLFRLVQLLQEAGLPPGVVNLVNGAGPVTGAALVAHPGVDLVSFTGGTETGRHIMAQAAMGLKKVELELGGKSANLVFDDADPEGALTAALLSIYSNNGQQCLAGSRILVQRGIADEFITRFVERAKAIKVGDPFDPATEVGPLAFQQHYERVLSYVDTACSQGADLLVGGARAPGFDKGYYFQPTAVLAPRNDLRVCQEEIFGPFATLQVFDTVDEGIALANQSRFGLVAYVWSESSRTLMRATQGIRAGTVWANTPLIREVRAPFGGYKQSGIGRDGHYASMDFYTESKTTSLPWDRIAMRPIGTGVAPTA